MIELYHCVAARSFRPVWMCEELGLDYRLHMLPFPPRALKREYLELNPLGTIPLLIDGDTRMTESAAMCEYLTARYGAQSGLGVTPQDPRFGDYLNGLHFGEATLTFPQTLVLRYARFETPERRSPQVAEDYKRWFLARLRAVETRLAIQAHWCGEAFTAADVSVGYALLLAEGLGLFNDFGPHTQAYWRRLQARPAFAKARAAELTAAADQGIQTKDALTG